MNVFRLCKSVYSKDLSGKGAALYGGRWNSKGIPVIYTSETRALCLLEAAVHFPLGNSPKDLALVTIEIPETINIRVIQKRELQEGWNTFPFHISTRKIGDKLLKELEYTVIKVPSALVPGEYNFLINPLHPVAGTITIQSVESFPIDQRLGISDQRLAIRDLGYAMRDPRYPKPIASNQYPVSGIWNLASVNERPVRSAYTPYASATL